MLNLIKRRGISIIEVIVAIGIFSIIVVGIISATLGLGFDVANSQNFLKARYLVQEAEEAVRAIRDYDFYELSAGQTGIDNSGGYWVLSGTSNVVDGFTRIIDLTEINQNKFEMQTTITWTSIDDREMSYVSTTRLTNWRSLVLYWIVDLKSEFEFGFFNSGNSEFSPGSVLLNFIENWVDGFVSYKQDNNGLGKVNEIVVHDNLLFAVSDNNPDVSEEEFVVYDLKDVSYGVVTELGSTEINASVNDLVVFDANDYALLATSSDTKEVSIVRLSDYSEVNTLDLDTGADANGVAMSGSSAVFVTSANSSEEVYVLNLSNPEGTLTVSGSGDIAADVYDVDVNAGYAFLGTNDSSGEFKVFRLSDYSVVNSVDLSGSVTVSSVYVDQENEIAYIGTYKGSNTEFYALNISNPQGSIAILGSVEINEDVTDIYVKDGYAYVATDDGSASQTGNEIRRINLSTYMVEDTGNLSDSAEAFAVWFQGSHIYAGTDSTSSEIQVLQSGGESGWDVPRIVETVDLPGSNDMNDIIISGDYAFAGRDTTAGQPEFIVFNISDPFNVTVAGSLEVGSDVNDLYMMGNYVYIATSDNNAEFQIINVTNKTAPTLTGIYNTSRTKDGLSVTGSGSVAYLGTEQDSGQTNNELFLINVSTLSSPTLYSSLEVGSNVIDLSNGSENLFIGTASPNQEVRTVDIANPATPSIVYTYNVTGSRIVNGILYDSSSKELHVTMTASGNNPNYVIFDVSNEVNFIELGGVVTTGDYNMHTLFVGFAGRTFVIAVTNDTGAEFKVIDTTVVESPFVRSSLDIGGDGMGVATTGSYMFVVGTADSQELIVITWGAPEVPEYARFGIYTSEEFSSDSDTTAWNTITWEQSGTGVIWFQTRTASSTGGTALATWMGPNGPGTYYSSTGSTIAISGDATGTRFMQFAAYLYGSGSATPILDSVTLDYSM